MEENDVADWLCILFSVFFVVFTLFCGIESREKKCDLTIHGNEFIIRKKEENERKCIRTLCHVIKEKLILP